jgi:predicted amidohydrolase YtcJ
MRLLYNARITTNNPARPFATAMAIDKGRIFAVGNDADVLSEFGHLGERQDLHGKTILPGLVDAHIHLEHYAFSLTVVDCETGTRAECLQRVAERAASTPAGEWIRGHGWNQNLWPEGFGSAADLDAIAPQNPVYLTAKSLHASWANSQALRQAGIDDDTPDPQDGKIVRDEHGHATGILLESAVNLVEGAIPAPTVNETARAILSAQQNLWQMGITGVHDYDQARCFSALQTLDLSGELRLRVVKSIPLDLLDQAVKVGLHTGFGSEFLSIGSVKMFADGALGPHTAAMLQPYEGEEENTGILFMDSEQILERAQQAASHGISVAIHAIGDRANHEVLDAYTHLRSLEKSAAIPHLRHRIEHVQCLYPGDFARLAEQDIIASVQPIHATSDMLMADRFWGSRSKGAYAFRTLLERNTRLVFGSDAPVESPNPWLGLHAAVTRRRSDGSPGPEGWYPDQRLTLEEALQGYTTGPAFAAGLEDRSGQLSEGYYADLIVLAESPFHIPPHELYQLKPVETMVAGEWVWQRGS